MGNIAASTRHTHTDTVSTPHLAGLTSAAAAFKVWVHYMVMLCHKVAVDIKISVTVELRCSVSCEVNKAALDCLTVRSDEDDGHELSERYRHAKPEDGIRGIAHHREHQGVLPAKTWSLCPAA